METQGFSFEAQFQSVIHGLHRLVKIMNYLTSFPEKNIDLAAKQKTDAEAILKDITHDTKQMKVILSHYQQDVCIPSLNTKQDKLEEFMASLETPKVTETDAKATTTKKKRTTRTSVIKTHLRTLTEMAKDIGRQEEESRSIKKLVSMADVVEALTHSVALTSAMDRRFNKPEAHESESDGYARNTQRESNGIEPINHVESYRNTNPDSNNIKSTILPNHQIQSDDIEPIQDIESYCSSPINYTESDGTPPDNTGLDGTPPYNTGLDGKLINHVQSDCIKSTNYIESDGAPPYNTELDDFTYGYDTESDGKLINHVQSDCISPTNYTVAESDGAPPYNTELDDYRYGYHTESDRNPMHHAQSRIRPTYYTESNGISSVHRAHPYHIGTGHDSVSGQTTVPYSYTSLTTTYSQITKYMNAIQRRLKSQLLRWSGGSRLKLFLPIVLIILTVLYCLYSNYDRCLCVQHFLSYFVAIDCCSDMDL